MCDYADSDDLEPIKASTATMRKARKNHRCCECGRTIAKGSRYRYHTWVWDNTAQGWKTCAGCLIREKAHDMAHEAIGEPAPWVQPRELNQSIFDCAREDPRYLSAFRIARRALATVSA